MKEDFYSTICERADGSRTEIRVHIRPEVRDCAERESSDPEEMIKGCVWRFIAQKHKLNEVEGDVVEFMIDEPTMLELINDLRVMKLAKKQVCRTSQAKS